MLKTKYQKPRVLGAKLRRSKTIPDQTMSVVEILSRFRRGIPVDIIQRQGTYIDQSEYDFEQMSRMDFADKAALAAELRSRAEAIQQKYIDDEREKRERKRVADAAASAQAAKGSGIGSLDNTMPVDTNKISK